MRYILRQDEPRKAGLSQPAAPRLPFRCTLRRGGTPRPTFCCILSRRPGSMSHTQACPSAMFSLHFIAHFVEHFVEKD